MQQASIPNSQLPTPKGVGVWELVFGSWSVFSTLLEFASSEIAHRKALSGGGRQQIARGSCDVAE